MIVIAFFLTKDPGCMSIVCCDYLELIGIYANKYFLKRYFHKSLKSVAAQMGV